MKTISRFDDLDARCCLREDKRVLAWQPTPEQLADDGHLDRIAAMTVDQWRALDRQRRLGLARIGDCLFRAQRHGAAAGLYSHSGRSGRTILRIDRKGNRTRFPSVLAAARCVDGSAGGIYAAIKQGRKYRNCRWEFEETTND